MPDNFFPPLRDDNSDIALVEGDKRYSYGEVNRRINRIATGLLGTRGDLQEERIAFFIPASLDYVAVMHAVWRAGGIAVPLNVASAVGELEHYLSCAGAGRLVVDPKYQSDELNALCDALNVELISVADIIADAAGSLPDIDPGRRSIMFFTSGTTSKPKGVVHTHRSISAQINCLLRAWAWTGEDVIPLFLPLHHVHGVINILSCGLWAGATVHLFTRFDAPTITEQVAANTYSVFMAVPTIYVKMIQYFDAIGSGQVRDNDQVKKICAGFAAMRLNISGSAACPVTLFNQWRDLTGQVLLERYGMTEIGMAISNPYDGERRAGCVGQALPGVEVQLFDEDDRPVSAAGVPGEIRIRGDNVFLEYWGNERATRESFRDGWFCSGDMAVIEAGYYRIMGRSSIDIIKSGGYKLSALEIEGVLLTHEAIAEVAVIGVEDETWGEAVAAVVVLKPGAGLDYETLKTWCEGKMSSYKMPKRLQVVDALPRNAMGKVTKPALHQPPYNL